MALCDVTKHDTPEAARDTCLSCTAGKRYQRAKGMGMVRHFHLQLSCKVPVKINGAFKCLDGLQ